MNVDVFVKSEVLCLFACLLTRALSLVISNVCLAVKQTKEF